MRMEEQMEFSRLMETITPTKDGIKVVKDWIIARPQHILVIADRLRRATEDQEAGFQKRLSILYLINDVLHHGLRKRSPEIPFTPDEFAAGIVTALPSIARASVIGASDEDRMKIFKVFEIWESRQIFPSVFIASLKVATTPTADVYRQV